MWFITASFLLFDILLRVFPNIMVTSLQRHFTISPFELSILSACFMYAYGLMQIPAGILIDRFGVTKPLFISASVTVISVLLMAATQSFVLACAARTLMGAGAAFAFLGCMQIIFTWFPVGWRALMTGATLTIGALGGILANSVLIHLVGPLGYRAVMGLIAALGVVIAGAIALWVREDGQQQHCTSLGKQLSQGLWQVLKNPLNWVIALCCGLFYVSYAVLNDLWGMSFLRVVDSLSPTAAGNIVSLIWGGWIIGSPLVGWWADSTGSPLKVLQWCGLLQLAALVVLLISPVHQIWFIGVNALIIGATASAMGLCYVIGQQSNPAQAASSSSAFINSMVSVVTFALLPAVGAIIGKGQSMQVLSEPPSAFRLGFLPLVISLVVGIMLIAMIPRGKAGPANRQTVLG